MDGQIFGRSPGDWNNKFHAFSWDTTNNDIVLLHLAPLISGYIVPKNQCKYAFRSKKPQTTFSNLQPLYFWRNVGMLWGHWVMSGPEMLSEGSDHPGVSLLWSSPMLSRSGSVSLARRLVIQYSPPSINIQNNYFTMKDNGYPFVALLFYGQP